MRLNQKAVIFSLNRLGAHYVTALILSYKRRHSDRQRQLMTMKIGGARTIEATIWRGYGDRVRFITVSVLYIFLFNEALMEP